MPTLEDKLALFIAALGPDIKALTTGLAAVSGFTIRSKTANYTALNKDVVLCNAAGGAFTITLPASPSAGDEIVVKKTDSSVNTVTIASGAALIDGSANRVLTLPNVSARLIYTGSTWAISSANGDVGYTSPVLVGGKMTRVNNANSINAALPTGAAAGQLAVVFTDHGYGPPTTKTGLTTIGENFGGAYYKILTGTDITNNYIALGFAGVYYGQVAVACVTGANASPIRTFLCSDNKSKVATMFTPDLAEPGDLALYFSGGRLDGISGMTAVFTKGTVIDSRIADTYWSAYLMQCPIKWEGVDMLGITWSNRDVAVDQGDIVVVLKS